MNANGSPKQVFIDITYELHELLEYIIVRTHNAEVSIDLKEKKKDAKVDIIYYKTFGRCYSIQLGKEIVARGINGIDFLSNMNLFIYFHHPGQFHSRSKSKLYTLKGHKYFMDMTYSIMENTLKSESTLPCSDETDFEFDNCFYQAIAQDLMNEFNCVVPFIKTSENNIICVKKSQTEIDEMMLAFKKSSSNIIKGSCMLPCASMDIFFGVLFDGIRNDGKSFLRIYLKNNVKFQQTVYDYTLLSLLAEIGGYTGLLLGISVANITTLLEKMFQWLNLVALT